jgi:hypothetical protein
MEGVWGIRHVDGYTCGEFEGKRPMEDLGIDGRKIKWTLQK